LSDVTVEMLERVAVLGEASEPCPYLPGRESRYRFMDGRFAGRAYRALLDHGYRRSGLLIYRPVCEGCRECQVIRVPVATFRRTKEQRRVWNRGVKLFQPKIAAPVYTPEKAALYERYLREHHEDLRDEVTEERYSQFLVGSCLEETFELQLWHGEALVAVSLLDRVEDVLSSVYCYFDPAFSGYSLGTLSALVEIELCRQWGLAYYHLGYYVHGCAAMDYKARFRPFELRQLDRTTWESFAEGRPRTGVGGAEIGEPGKNS